MLDRLNGKKISNGMLAVLYEAHAEWIAGMDFVCRKGCAVCCTQSVTMTTLEGRKIIDYLAKNKREIEIEKFSAKVRGCPTRTTNGFARRCFEGKEDDNIDDTWDLTPCPFLSDQSCSIYPVRPFGCRALVSHTPCYTTGYAEAAPLVITVHTVLMQLIEQCGNGGWWGNMLDILSYLQARTHKGEEAAPEDFGLLACEPMPGLLVPPEEQAAVERFFEGLFSKEVIEGMTWKSAWARLTGLS